MNQEFHESILTSPWSCSPTCLWIDVIIRIRTIVPIHERKSRGNKIPENWQWGTLIQIVPPDFCHVSKFQAPDCLHYYAVKCTS
jgi:hypothetical protein